MNSLFAPRTMLVGALVAGASTQAFAALTEATDADKAPGKPLHAFIKYTEALQKGDKAEALKYGSELSVGYYFDKDPIFNGRRAGVDGRDTTKSYELEVKKQGDEFCVVKFRWLQKNTSRKESSDIYFIKVGDAWKVCEPKEIKGKK